MSRRFIWWPAAAVILAGLLLAGCSFNYDEASLEEELAESLPDSVLINARHTIMRNGRVSVILEAKRLEHYNRRNLTVLTEVYFRELDAAGEVVTEGWADTAYYDTETENAEVSGNVVFFSRAEKSGIFASRLLWDDAERRLYSDEGQDVTVRRDDGSQISGSDFDADLGRRSIRFRKEARGTLVINEEDGSSE